MKKFKVELIFKVTRVETAEEVEDDLKTVLSSYFDQEEIESIKATEV